MNFRFGLKQKKNVLGKTILSHHQRFIVPSNLIQEKINFNSFLVISVLKMFLCQVRSSCRGFSGLANIDLPATEAAAAGDAGAGCDAGDATDGGDDATDGGDDATDGGDDATDGRDDATDGGDDSFLRVEE